MDLQEIRKELDVIDRQIVDLYEKRMKLCGDVAEYKISVESRCTTGSGRSRSWRRSGRWRARSTARERRSCLPS